MRGLNVQLVVPALLLGLAAGCASRGESQGPQPLRTGDGYIARPAAALVYAPPLVREMEPGELDAVLARAGRGEAALLGYDLPTVSTYFLRVEDEQGFYGWGHGFGYGGRFDDYDRTAITTRSFVRYR